MITLAMTIEEQPDNKVHVEAFALTVGDGATARECDTADAIFKALTSIKPTSAIEVCFGPVETSRRPLGGKK